MSCVDHLDWLGKKQSVTYLGSGYLEQDLNSPGSDPQGSVNPRRGLEGAWPDAILLLDP